MAPICFLLLIVVLPGKLTVVVEFCYNSASSFLKLHGLVFRFLDFCFSYWLYYSTNFPSLLVNYFVIICSFNFNSSLLVIYIVIICIFDPFYFKTITNAIFFRGLLHHTVQLREIENDQQPL